MNIGYARVSREDQDLTRQITALEGCDKIYADKISGASTNRPELDKMLGELQAGDCVVVQKLDRFGRSINDLLNKVEMLRARGVGFRSLTDNFDTTNANGRLMFHLLAAFAEFEREMIKERTKDGLKQAKKNGVKLGRPCLDYDKDLAVLRGLIDQHNREEIQRITGWTNYKYYRLLNRI